MAIPDEQIHPHATGEAEKTVRKHQEPQELVLYAGWFCPFVQRTWVVLEEKGIPYQYNEINPYKKSASLLAINPKGLVPTVEYKGKALYESLVICEFLEEAYPSHKPNLLPPDPFDRGIARIWIDHISKQVIPAHQRLMQFQEVERQEAAKQEFYEALRKLAGAAKGPYFFGEEFSLVDVAIAPWVMREFVIKDTRKYNREDVSPEWSRYAGYLAKRESVLRTQSDQEHYWEIYNRYLRDEAQSEVAKATRSGVPLP